MLKTFVSYRHSDGEWVWSRLKPLLEAAGVEVLIDAERFEAGREVVGQMDDLQDAAQLHLLVITEAYLDSDYCRHEMDRALATDPAFASGNMIPIRLDGCKWPLKLTRKGTAPLFVDLRQDRDDAPWELLLKSCQGQLDVSPTHWLKVRDDVARYLQRDQSVNLVADGGLKVWRSLLAHLNSVKLPKALRTELKTIDLESGRTASRDGLLRAILAEFGHAGSLPGKPRDLVRFAELMNDLPRGRLALLHFDAVLASGFGRHMAASGQPAQWRLTSTVRRTFSPPRSTVSVPRRFSCFPAGQ